MNPEEIARLITEDPDLNVDIRDNNWWVITV